MFESRRLQRSASGLYLQAPALLHCAALLSRRRRRKPIVSDLKCINRYGEADAIHS